MADTQEKSRIEFANLKPTYSWADVSKDYAFFTPALIYWHTGADRDLVSDYVNEVVKDKVDYPKIFVTDDPIFNIENPIVHIAVATNIGGVQIVKMDLSRMMYLCPLSVWDGLASFLGGCGFVDRKRDFYSTSIRCNDMTMYDYPDMKAGNFPPKPVTVAAFGIYSNESCNIWRYSLDNMFEQPRAVKADPAEVICQDGMMFWRGQHGA